MATPIEDLIDREITITDEEGNQMIMQVLFTYEH